MLRHWWRIISHGRGKGWFEERLGPGAKIEWFIYKTLWIMVWLVALVPMIHVTYLVRHYGVEVPTLDDWAMAPLIVKAQTGQLTFTDIFEQQQEARTVLPKLIFILSAAQGHWDARDQMMLGVVSCWLTAAGIFVLLRRSGLGVGAVAICFWLIVLTIFSLAQYELWIFASGFPSFLPALFVVAGYFWDYQKPAYLPAFAPPVAPLEDALFFLEFLGGGLAYALKDQAGLAAGVFGAVQLALCLSALVFALRRFRDRMFLAKVAPWFALAWYALGSAFLAALGRVGFGANYALASRYVPFSLYLTVAVIALLAIIANEIMKTRPSKLALALVLSICLVLAVGYLVPYKTCSANTLFFLRALSAKDRLARGAVLFSAVLDTSEVIKKTAYPGNADPVVQNAAALDQLKLLRPPLAQTNRLNALSLESADGRRASGSCETLSLLPDLYCASGWAVLNAKGRPADCVLVAYQDPQLQEWIACAISDSFEMRPIIVKRFRSMDQLWAGWTATFSRSAIPAGAPLSFWAVDAEEAKLYRLEDKSFRPSP